MTLCVSENPICSRFTFLHAKCCILCCYFNTNTVYAQHCACDLVRLRHKKHTITVWLEIPGSVATNTAGNVLTVH